MNPIMLNDKILCLQIFRAFRSVGAVLSWVSRFLDEIMAEVASLSQAFSLAHSFGFGIAVFIFLSPFTSHHFHLNIV